MSDRDQSLFASPSVARHLARGAVGFGLIGSGFALGATGVGPVALGLVVPGLVALRGCPMCWTLGLIETVSAGRLRRACSRDGCSVGWSPPSALIAQPPRSPLSLLDLTDRRDATDWPQSGGGEPQQDVGRRH